MKGVMQLRYLALLLLQQYSALLCVLVQCPAAVCQLILPLLIC